MRIGIKDKFLNRTIIYTLGEFLVKGSKFLLLPFYTRVFSVEEFGVLQQIIILSSMLGFLIDFSSKESLLKLFYDYKEKNKEKQFIGTLFLFIIVITSIFLFTSIGLNFSGLLIINNVDYFEFILYIIGYALFISLSNLGLTLLRIQNKVSRYAFLSFLLTITELVLIILFVKYLSLGLLGKFQASLIISLLFFSFLYLSILSPNIILSYQADQFKRFISFSWPLTLTNLMGWFIVSIDMILINIHFGIKELALFSLGVQVLQIYKTLINSSLKSFNVLLFERFNEMKAYLNEIVLAYFSLFSLIACLFVFLSKPIVNLIGTQEYSSAFVVIPLLILSRLLSSTGLIYQYVMQKLEKNKEILFSFFISCIILIALSSYLIPLYKILGAAISATVSQIALFLLLYLRVKKYLNFSWDWRVLLSFCPLFLSIIMVYFEIFTLFYILFFCFTFTLVVYLNGKNFYLYNRIFKS